MTKPCGPEPSPPCGDKNCMWHYGTMPDNPNLGLLNQDQENADWINDTLQAEILHLLQTSGPIRFDPEGKAAVDGIMQRAMRDTIIVQSRIHEHDITVPMDLSGMILAPLHIPLSPIVYVDPWRSGVERRKAKRFFRPQHLMHRKSKGWRRHVRRAKAKL